ncbi:MAG: dephospho-CoA kinase, partial [Planctomycetes bacterium]|nr:dephospho-CoA kinase [Planctomycetota bacterium]
MNVKLKAKPVIGIVGGIGSGKSEVARMLANSGGMLFDADAEVRILL